MKSLHTILPTRFSEAGSSRFGAGVRRAATILAASIAACVLSANPVLIGHKELPPEQLKQLDAQQVFLGKQTSLPGGRAIQFAVLREGPVHETFLVNQVKKQPSQFMQYWKTAVFSGRGKMPPEMATEEDMARFVAETPGAIGYISSDFAKANNVEASCSVAW